MIAQLDDCLDLIDWSDPVNWDDDLNRGLVSWWLAVPGTHGWGSYTIRDLCRTYDGTLTNMTPSSDWKGDSHKGGFGSINYVGTNEHVLLSSSISTALGGTSAATWAAWVRADTNVTWGSIVKSWPISPASNHQVHLGFDSTSQKFSNYILTSSAQYGPVIASSAATLGEWYRVVSTYDGSNLRLYVNGIEAGTAVAATGTLNSGDSYYVGIKTPAAVQAWDGQIDDVRVLGRAWSAADVLADYRDSSSFYPRTLSRSVHPWYAMMEAAAGGGTILPWMQHLCNAKA